MHIYEVSDRLENQGNSLRCCLWFCLALDCTSVTEFFTEVYLEPNRKSNMKLF